MSIINYKHFIILIAHVKMLHVVFFFTVLLPNQKILSVWTDTHSGDFQN